MFNWKNLNLSWVVTGASGSFRSHFGDTTCYEPGIELYEELEGRL